MKTPKEIQVKHLALLAALVAVSAFTGCSSLMQSHDGANGRSVRPSGVAVPGAAGNATPLIRESDCIGAVVNSVCHGVPTPEAEIKIRTGQMPRCYGTMIGGQCTGPMF